MIEREEKSWKERERGRVKERETERKTDGDKDCFQASRA